MTRHRLRKAVLAIGAIAALPLSLIAAAPQVQASHTSYEGKVIAATSLNVRSAPTAAATRVGSLSRGSTVTIQCKVFGPTVAGNALWYKLSSGKWVTARYVSNVGAAPAYC